MLKKIKLTTVIEEVPEGGFIAYIEEIPGVNTQGETLDEARANLFDALELTRDFII
jgi:predicted RNase H-like HicB family nuclease